MYSVLHRSNVAVTAVASQTLTYSIGGEFFFTFSRIQFNNKDVYKLSIYTQRTFVSVEK